VVISNAPLNTLTPQLTHRPTDLPTHRPANSSYQEGVLDIEGYGLGNQVMLALAESVGRMELHSLNISANRATDTGLKVLLSELANSKHFSTLDELDLSCNKLGRGSVSEV